MFQFRAAPGAQGQHPLRGGPGHCGLGLARAVGSSQGLGAPRSRGCVEDFVEVGGGVAGDVLGEEGQEQPSNRQHEGVCLHGNPGTKT